MFNFFKKRSKGVAVIETAITLPIILYVVFFSIELIRMSIAQSAIDAITKECTLKLMATGTVEGFDNIFQKYQKSTWGIPLKNFRYYVRIYADDENINPITFEHQGIYKMMQVIPYGGETIGWAENYSSPSSNSPNNAAKSYSYGLESGHAFLNDFRTKLCNGIGGEVGNNLRAAWLESKIPSGNVFVLTVALNFPFSSAFVKKLFGGGSNATTSDTTGGSTISNVFILWARGSGIVN